MLKRGTVEDLLKEYEELERRLGAPDVVADPNRSRELAKQYKRLSKVAEKARRWISLQEEIENAREMADEETSPDLKAYLREEIERIEGELESLSHEIKSCIVTGDLSDVRNALVEIRAGTGGEEAALFAADLFKMYSRYAEDKGLKVSIIDAHSTPLGGYREITFIIEGQGAYGRLKFESGVHRVQRVPQTESGGRIHTSSASVVVIPEAEEEEVDIPAEDLRIETFRSSGPGGQHVNVTDSAVRIIHVPTGIIVTCQDERSQHKNRAKALRVLRAHLLDLREKEKAEGVDKIRRTAIGTGDRSEKIRTYNYPQRRITDHRIGLDLFNFESILSGGLDALIDPLIEAEERKKLENFEAKKGA